MSRHLALTILVLLVVSASIWAWVEAMGRPPEPPQAAEPQVPQEVQLRLDALTEKVRELSKPPPPPEPEPEPPPPSPNIQRVQVNGADVAELLGIAIWKFRFRLPPGRYTGYVWLEHWTRDAAEPEYRLLLTATGQWEQEELVLKLPTPGDRRLFLSIGELHVENDPNAEPVDLPTPIGSSVLDERPLRTGEPVHLVTLTHNQIGMAVARLENVHRENDETVYLKLAFTAGDSIPFDPEQWIPSPGRVAQ